MNHNSIKNLIHNRSVSDGEWKTSFSHEHYLAVIISLISKAVDLMDSPTISTNEAVTKRLVAVMIGLFDLAGHLEIDFDRMAPCRYYRAFHRFTFNENAFALIKGFGRDNIVIERRIQWAIEYIRAWAESMGIDIEGDVLYHEFTIQ